MADEAIVKEPAAVLGGSEDGGTVEAKADAPAEKATEAKAEPTAKEAPAAEAKVEGEKPADKVDAKAEEKAADATEKALEKLAWPEEGFPEDWRERLIKDMKLEGEALKKAKEAAKRSSSPAELLRSVMAGTTKITELTAELKGAVKIPGDKAKPEEIEAFQKAWGVPESPDKYDLKPLGELNEVDKEIWDEVLPGFHKGSFNQSQIAVVAQALDTAKTIAEKRMEDRAKVIDEATRESLLLEYGSSKAVKANIELANRYLGELLGEHMDKEARQNFMNLRLEDGTRIGSLLPFTKAVIEKAREWAPDSLPEIGEGGQQVDPEKRIKDIVKLSHSQKPEDKKEYQRLQPELDRLIAAKNRRDAGGQK